MAQLSVVHKVFVEQVETSATRWHHLDTESIPVRHLIESKTLIQDGALSANNRRTQLLDYHVLPDEALHLLLDGLLLHFECVLIVSGDSAPVGLRDMLQLVVILGL